MAYDLDSVRSQFPILSEKVHDRPLVYLDNAATSQKPQCVIDAYDDVYRRVNANIHRGVHHLSNVCTSLYEDARKTVASFIGASDASEIVFTRNTTEAVNLVANSFGNKFVNPGDEVVLTVLEHHSNIVPWQLLCQRRGAKLRVVDIRDDGSLRLDQLGEMLSQKTRIVCAAHVSNVMGTVNDVRQIARMAHAVGAACLVDAAQSVPHFAVDVNDLECDFLAFSGHKIYAPLGSGALYARRHWLDEMDPWMGGGEMIDKVSFAGTTFAEPPLKFEAGTPDYAAAIALAEAIRFVQKIGLDNIAGQDEALARQTIDGLQSIGGIRIVGTHGPHSGAVSFLIDGVHPYDASMILDKMGIAVRTGHHCAQPLMERFSIPGTVRASFGVYTSKDDIDALLNGVERVKQMFA
ncbi:MAG: cysteine desulfurase [Bacteroidales bacterium]|nr:cysteine desulfurase [Bacteroidales bacterium]